jgi:hypothetical protein
MGSANILANEGFSVVGILGRFCVAAIAGAVIAWVVAAFVLDAMFAAGGYTREALVELPPWAFGVIGGGGAVVALTLVWAVGRSPLPAWLRLAIVGGLIGVAAVVVATLAVAYSFGGPSSKGQAPYLHAGLVHGVPVGLVTGVLLGLVRGRRPSAHSSEQFDDPNANIKECGN